MPGEQNDVSTPPHNGLDGRVLWVGGGFYAVQTSYGTIRCLLRERLRKNLVYPESRSRRRRVQQVKRRNVVEPVVAGDCVVISLPDVPQSGTEPIGTIDTILPRTRAFTRRAAGAHDRSDRAAGQTLIANLDQLIVVIAAQEPAPSLGMVDRFLAQAEAAEVPALICVNKIDLGVPEELNSDLAVYRSIGYAAVCTSAATGSGLEHLRQRLRDHVSALVGPSGVGKSTLLNAIQPGLGLRVGQLSAATGKGRHITRHAQLIPLEGGGFVADTPGLRQLGLWDVAPEEIEWCFREFQPLLGTCKFANCVHIGEVGCAIEAAVESGAVDDRRWASYHRLLAGGYE